VARDRTGQTYNQCRAITRQSTGRSERGGSLEDGKEETPCSTGGKNVNLVWVRGGKLGRLASKAEKKGRAKDETVGRRMKSSVRQLFYSLQSRWLFEEVCFRKQAQGGGNYTPGRGGKNKD